MRWFRFYDEVLDDPKVQRLPGELFKAWVNLMCLANRGKPRGTIHSIADIAFGLRVSEGEAERLVEELRTRGLLEWGDEDTLRPHNWRGRQFESDDVKPRVEKHRAQKAEAAVCNVTSNDVRNVTSNVACNAPDTDTETETETLLPPHPLFPTKPADAGRALPAEKESSKPKRTKPQKPDGYGAMMGAWAAEIGRPQTPAERGKYDSGTIDLLKAGKGAELVPRLVKAYRARFPGMAINPAAIAANLTELERWLESHEPRESETRTFNAEEQAARDQQKVAEFLARTQPPLQQTRTNGKYSGP